MEVVVLLGTSFARLEHQGTRWRYVLREWAAVPGVRRLVAVDFPKLSPRHLLGSELAVSRSSWLEGCELVEARVPVHRSSTLGAGLAWPRTGRALRRLLGPAQGPRVVVAATPLFALLLPHLGADRAGFDAVDDWRALPGMAHLGRHVTRGYASLARGTTCTSVSEPLSATLARDFGLAPVTVPNGVDLSAYVDPRPAPDGLPEGPFAVYVGVVQERFDLALLDQLTDAGVPVVVAGPATGAIAAHLESSPATWLGRIDVDLVPGLLQRATVGLVPHVVDPLTASMDPMKVLEYLAAGLRVVTTPVARSVVSERLVEATGPAFVSAVRDALAAPRLPAPDDAVRDRDWSAVATRLLEVHA
jgi:glycosyltransferase involved in cell wall biosynthesis